MNRNGRCWPLGPASRSPMLLLLLILLFVGIAVCEEQKTAISNKVDQDVAGVRSFFDYIFGSETPEGQSEKALPTGRTFGVKRIQFMLMPMVYKMGVMMTMLAVLTVISMKGLMIGVMLLVLKLSAIFGKLYASWGHQSYGHHASWTPPQPVHVHVHNSGSGGSYGPHGPHGHVYSGWESAGPPDENYYYKG